MSLVIIFIFSFTAYAQSLTFNAGSNWELKKNLLGADYALVFTETSNSILIKKMPEDIESNDVEAKIRKAISDKESSPVPWSDVQIKKIQNIEWFPGKNGKILTVEHKKKNIPHTSLIGIQPLNKEHFFIFYSEPTLNFMKNEMEVLHALKSVKGH